MLSIVIFNQLLMKHSSRHVTYNIFLQNETSWCLFLFLEIYFYILIQCFQELNINIFGNFKLYALSVRDH